MYKVKQSVGFSNFTAPQLASLNLVATPDLDNTGLYFLSDGRDAAKISSDELELAKSNKIDQIRSEFNVREIAPVVDSNSNSWAGGWDSAMKLDAALRISEKINLSTVTFYDSGDDSHVLSLADALNVVLLIAGSYQSLLAEKKAFYRLVRNSLSLSEVEQVPINWS